MALSELHKMSFLQAILLQTFKTGTYLPIYLSVHLLRERERDGLILKRGFMRSWGLAGLESAGLARLEVPAGVSVTVLSPKITWR